MEKDQLQQFKNKLTRGVFALASRTFILQVISFGATFILTVLLSPSSFGVFFVVSAVISFLTYFSDIGFAAALIQKPEEPSIKDLSSAFTVQHILVGTLVLLAFILTNTVAGFYNLEGDGVWLFQALLISF